MAKEADEPFSFFITTPAVGKPRNLTDAVLQITARAAGLCVHSTTPAVGKPRKFDRCGFTDHRPRRRVLRLLYHRHSVSWAVVVYFKIGGIIAACGYYTIFLRI